MKVANLNLQEQQNISFVEWKVHWLGRILSVANQALSTLIAFIFRIAMKCLPVHTNQVETKTNILQKIDQAKIQYRQDLDALTYIRKFKLKQTISLFCLQIDNFKILLHSMEKELPKEAVRLDSFGQEMDRLSHLLKQKQKTLVDDKISADEIAQHIKDVFAYMKDFHPNLQAINKRLPKGSTKKQHITLCKMLVERVHKEQAIYKTPSSDPYVLTLQKNVQKSFRIL